jgi:tetratricopeptide (TPR) repeat protein
MPYRYKILLFLFAACSFLSSRASDVPDTTNKKSGIPVTKAVYDIGDFIENWKEGVAYIRQGSLEKGIHLLSVSVERANSARNIEAVLDYGGNEMISLLAAIDSGKLSPQEKELGLAFFRGVFTKNNGPTDTDLAIYFKQSPNTFFTQRLNVLFRVFTGSTRLNSVLNKMLKDYPSLVSVNTLKAETLFDEGKFEESAGYCTKVTGLSPGYAFAWHLRGKCYAELNQPEKAAADDNKAIRISPNDFEAIYSLSEVLLGQDKYREAIPGYKKTLLLNPGYQYSNYNLARCYRGLDMPDSALYNIGIHIRQHPDDGDGYDIKGDIYYDKADYPQAIKLYSQAIGLNPGSASFYDDRGDAYFYADSVDKALGDFQRSISLDKKRAYPNDRIGDCYYRKEDYKKAISCYQAALRIDPNYKYAFVDLNYCYVKQGNFQAGIDACKKAVVIDSTYDSALGNLGWAYYCAGDFDNCIKFSYKALKYNEKAVYAMFNIALATLRKGDFEKAKELYQFYITKCREKDYEITSGAVDDLQDLIKKKIAAEQATFIIDHILKEK